MLGKNDPSLQFLGTSDGEVEVQNFKPHQHSIPIRGDCRITDRTMVVLTLPMVQLQDEFALMDQLFVFLSSVIALEAKELLIPTTTGFDIMNCQERLYLHDRLVRNFNASVKLPLVQRPFGSDREPMEDERVELAALDTDGDWITDDI